MWFVRLIIFLLLAIVLVPAKSQQVVENSIREMTWGMDYEVFLRLENDTSYQMDVRSLFHVKPGMTEGFSSEFIYFPVGLSEEYVRSVKAKSTDGTEMELKSLPHQGYSSKTLWGALHLSLGGGWVHFTNCILYAFESGNLSLTAPLMVRPQTDWKPNPVTDTYKRTKDWKYYVPVEYKQALKEYNLRVKRNEMGDLKNIPTPIIELFLNTSDKDYLLLVSHKKTHEISKIDLVKLLLGVNYLSEPQISYIRSSILSAVKQYSARQLPSVLIFDEFDAAAAMTLDQGGYRILKIVFRQGANLEHEEMQQRRSRIENVVEKINNYNNEAFQKRLEQYYKE